MSVINHYTAVQYRITGAGNFSSTLFDYDEITSQALTIIQLGLTSGIEPVVLANFQSYKVKLRGEVTQISSGFKINHIIIFAKPVFTQLPG
jgi:hypothetical protein